MRKLWLAAMFVGSFSACSDDSSGSSGGETPGVGQDGNDPPPVRAEFGLDARPSNTTCLAHPRPPAAGEVKLERVYENVVISRPMMMAQAPGDPTRWFVAQRDGKIFSFPVVNPPNQPTLVADTTAISGRPIFQDFEGGFLGIAFHPKFAENGRLFVTFTTSGESAPYGSEVGYLTSTDNGATFSSYTRILHFDRTKLEHNGGGIAFGKDGYLYLGFGDMTDPLNAQNKTHFFGKVLRIDVDKQENGKPYGIPPSNPFANGGGAPEIFAYGFRNPFRLSIDRATGELWLGDVGDATYEEVNKVALGANHGWPCREGMHDHPVHSLNPAACPSKVGLVDPIVEHMHPTPNSRSITGGVVYRGKEMPAFQGTYLYADFIQLEAWALPEGSTTPVRINENGPVAGFGAFNEDLDGEVYVTAVFQDAIYKLSPMGPVPPSMFPERLSATGCVDPADPKKPAPGLVSYGVNSELWSDGAEKHRWMAIPDGTTIAVGPDGDFDFPVGTVLVKEFRIGGKRVETRLLERHDDGEWAGYSFEWDDAESDAFLLPSGKTKVVGDATWSFPSRTECMRCHTAAAGRTLGLEIGQQNGDHVYATTNRLANQLKTLDHIGMFSAPVGDPASLGWYPPPFSAAPLDARARSYLHANCSHCHRPEGGAPRSSMDLRFFAADTKACNVVPEIDDLGVPDARLLAPGAPERSIVSIRVHATDARRMPPLATRVVHAEGAALLDEWIRGLTCP